MVVIGGEQGAQKKRERRCIMEARVLCDRLLVVCTDSDRTPDSPDLQWRALLVCFREVELNPHTPPVSGFTSVFLCFGCFLAVWVDYWMRTTRKLRLQLTAYV